MACALLTGATAFGAATAIENEPPISSDVIELPTYTIRGERILPQPESWRYVRIGNFEILSNASDSASRAFIKDFCQIDLIIRAIWPSIELVQPQVPVALIVCARGSLYEEFDPSGLIVEEFWTGRPGDAPIAAAPKSILYNDDEGAAILVDLSGEGYGYLDPYRQFYMRYMRYLFSRVEPRLPGWCEEGLSRVFAGLDYTKSSVTLAQVEGGTVDRVSESEIEIVPDAAEKAASASGDFNFALLQRKLLPFAEFFVDQGSRYRAQWSAQCHGFVHMCVYGRGQRYQKGFLEFVTRSAREPATEALFRECFGKTYKEMMLELRGYVQFTDHRYLRYRAKERRLPEPPTFELRAATQAEIGRLKATAFRLSGRSMEAGNQLVIAYLRGERDPQLLAALGLHERSLKKDERARKFLESAAQAGEPLPARAYLELARLRYEEATAQPAGARGGFSVPQVRSVLAPLFAARRVRPPLAEAYCLIADTWARSEIPPGEANIEVLLEGVVRCPRDVELVHAASAAYARLGLREQAESLIAHGRRLAKDEATRARFDAIAAAFQSSGEPADRATTIIEAKPAP